MARAINRFNRAIRGAPMSNKWHSVDIKINEPITDPELSKLEAEISDWVFKTLASAPRINHAEEIPARVVQIWESTLPHNFMFGYPTQPPAPPAPFRPNDIVRLRGGRRLMTVVNVDMEAGNVNVVWWVNQATQETANGAFPIKELLLVRRDKP